MAFAGTFFLWGKGEIVAGVLKKEVWGALTPIFSQGEREENQVCKAEKASFCTRGWHLPLQAGAAGLALPDRGRSGPLKGQQTTRSGERGG